MRLERIIFAGAFLAMLCGFGLNARPANQAASLKGAADYAVAQSKLTSQGSAPFHLRAMISEITNPDSDYKAQIEEYWASPTKWRRTIQSPGFSQTLILNGDTVSEQDTGDYYPLWLRNMVTAIFDPIPMIDQLDHLNTQLPKPNRKEQSISCARLQTQVGVAPVRNAAFLVFCFDGNGLLESVVTPQYSAEFKDYRAFSGKRIARRIEDDPEPGTTLQAEVVELTKLPVTDEKLFSVQQPTPAAARIRSVSVSEDVLHSLFLETPKVAWPTVRSGKTSGVLSMYVSVDRTGRVREAWPLNSDNAGLDDPAREQVRKWKLKPAVSGGVPVQVDSVLTLAFDTKIANSIPVLSDQQARELASNIVEAVAPSGTPPGTKFTISVSVDANGKMIGAGNPDNLPSPLFLAAYRALRQWRFRPYVHDGQPDAFQASITFSAQP